LETPKQFTYFMVLAPNRLTWKLAFHLKPPGKSRALAEGTPMIDSAGIGAYWKKPRWEIANHE
jgi:hypothetical protein